jgi:hypothetical protein
MRRKMFWQAGVFAALTFGGCFGQSGGEVAFVGVSPAEAKAYYTRKRVNGRWVTGRFAKRSGDVQSVATEPPEAPRIKVSVVEPTLTSHASPALGRHSEPGAPAKRPGPQSATAPLAQAPLVPPLANIPLVSASEAEHLGKLRQALQARATALTTGSVVEVAHPAPEPQSVSLDFRSGIKTTLFSDGTIVTEPFDTAALKGLAAAPNQAKAGR